MSKSFTNLEEDDSVSGVTDTRPSTPSGSQDSRKPENTRRDHLQPQSTRSSRYSVPEIPRRTHSSTPISVQSYLGDFHTLRWIAIQRAEGYQGNERAISEQTTPQISQQSPQPRKSYDQKVESFLDDLYKILENQQDPKKRSLFKRCQPKSLGETEKALVGMARAKLDKIEAITMKENLLSAAESAFQAFLPLDQEGAICSKYWGAIHRSITVIMSLSPLDAILR